MTRRAVVWFRRDLRLADNPAWAAATEAADEVVPLVVLDPVAFGAAGAFRRAQYLAELAALDAALGDLGGRLRLVAGPPTEVVPDQARVLDADLVTWNADVSPYARRRDAAVAETLGESARSHHGLLVHPPGAVLTAKGTISRVFTPFHRVWRDTPLDPWPEPGDAEVVAAPADDLPEPDRAPPQEPGEAAASERLDSWLDRVDDYGERRDTLADDHGTSGLSVDLHLGTLAARHVLDVVGSATEGREAFTRQLAWRDWYAHLSSRSDLAAAELNERYADLPWRDDPDAFEAWAEGRTGYPVIDAAMRQLAATGRMHNRARMLAGSFLVKHLLLDWRLGERHFRRLLLDGDLSQNAGNWQWVAGVGADAAPYFRIFNPVSQARRHDPDGAYVRRWVPELAGLEGDDVHAPWELGPLELAAAGITLGEDYPEPMVDHKAARERALEVYGAQSD